jgi:hypothetical protein
MDPTTIANSILQFLGTIASIVGFPYAVFVAQKQKRENTEFTKRQITERLAQVVITNGRIDGVEALAVIRSELRKASIPEKKVLASELFEDLINLIAATPLLDSTKKSKAIVVLKEVLNEFLLLQHYNSLSKRKQKKFLGVFAGASDQVNAEQSSDSEISANQVIFDVDAHNKSLRTTFLQTVILLIISTILALVAVISLFVFPSRPNDLISINVNWIVLFSGLIGIVALIYNGIRQIKK